jgi:gliding motility-associated-like protein
MDVVTVFVVEGPKANAGVDKAICFGESIEIGAKPAGSGGTIPYLYVWTPGSSLNSNVAENPIASPQMTTTYILTVYDANNCQDTDSMVVVVNPLPIPVIIGLDDQYCIYEGIIELTGNPPGGVFSGPGIAGSTFIVEGAGPGTHVINYTVVDQNGCKGEVNQVVQVDRMPIIWAGPDKTVYLGQDTRLDATSEGNYTYTWTPDTYLSDPTVLNPDVIKPLQTTTYTLLAVDDNGCEATDEVTVFVDVNTPIQIMVPNIFSPNGDGVNDTWVIPILDFFPDNNVKVFNRWGMLVFEADNYNNGNAWDGGDLPEGAYYYIIQLSLQGDKVYKGHVNIVR